MEGPCFAFGMFVGVVIILCIDGCIDSQPSYIYQKEAIQAGVGRYNEKTAKFEWIPPVKEDK